MGFYINPSNLSKETWLALTATKQMDAAPHFEDTPDKQVLVCLVDNGPFKAAGIVYSNDEYSAFTYEKDNRKKIWYYVPKLEVIRMCPAVADLLV